MEHRSASALGTARLNLRRRLRPQVTITSPPDEAHDGVVVDWDVPVPVRDGTVLRANVFRPAGPGRHPVIACALPYGKDALPKPVRWPLRWSSGAGWRIPAQYRAAANDEPMTFSAWTAHEAPDPAHWVPRGYVVVVADLRGWGTSAGEPEPFGPHEGRDVHDLVEWAAARPWSNGKVGMSGVSYLAISQWTGAAERPPHLAAITPWEGFTDAYRDFAYPGGIRENGFAVIWSTLQRLAQRHAPSFRAAQKAHPLRDAWWAQRSPDLERIEVPALVCASFSDHCLHSRGSFEGYARISSTHKWLYTHRGPKWSTYYGADALAAQERFFARFLRGSTGDQDTEVLGEGRVRVEVRASRSQVAAVRSCQQWPPEQVQPLVLHLDAGASTTGGALRAQAPARAARVVARRRRALRFTWRFERETDVIGPMRLRVPVSLGSTENGADGATSSGDLTLFAGVRKLSGGREVIFEGPYGFPEDLVTRGWLRASHRASDPARETPWQAHHPHDATEPVPVGQPVELDLALLPSATRFAAGEELVLELRDRWFFPANQLTGAFPAVYAHSRRQRWAVHTGGAHQATLMISCWQQ